MHLNKRDGTECFFFFPFLNECADVSLGKTLYSPLPLLYLSMMSENTEEVVQSPRGKNIHYFTFTILCIWFIGFIDIFKIQAFTASKYQKAVLLWKKKHLNPKSSTLHKLLGCVCKLKGLLWILIIWLSRELRSFVINLSEQLCFS